MPKVAGKKFPYTPKGKAAKKAAKKAAAKKKMPAAGKIAEATNG